MWARSSDRISWAWAIVGSKGKGLRRGSECALFIGREHRAEKPLQTRGRICLCGTKESLSLPYHSLLLRHQPCCFIKGLMKKYRRD